MVVSRFEIWEIQKLPINPFSLHYDAYELSRCPCAKEKVLFFIMPRGPKGQKRPADVIGNAVRVMQIATGEIKEVTNDPKAIARGKKGGLVRASELSARKRRQIARKAAEARWANARKTER